MIVDVAVVVACTDQTASLALGADGVLALHPVRHVIVVDALFHDEIAAEPREVVPVAHLVFQLSLARLTFVVLARAGTHVVDTNGIDAAHRAVVDPLNRFFINRAVSAVQADADFQVLALRLFGRRQDRANACGVGGHRLFHECVLAGADGRLEVSGTKPGRRGQQDNVHVVQLHDLAVGIQTGKASFRRHVDFGCLRTGTGRPAESASFDQ